MESKCSKALCQKTQETFNILGKKRNIFILKEIGEGNNSFMNIKRAIGNPSSKILTSRLEELTTYNYVSRNILSDKPLKVSYTLTDSGKQLAELIHGIVERCKKTNQL